MMWAGSQEGASHIDTRAGCELDEAYRDRLRYAQQRHASGDVVVGIVGGAAPTELIRACGAVPVTITEDLRTSTPNADQLMDSCLPARSRALVDAALGGDWDCLDLVVLGAADYVVYQFVEVALRSGLAALTPPLYLFDVIRHSKPFEVSLARLRYKALSDRLAALTGVRPDRARTVAAVHEGNEVRRAQRALTQQRRSGALPGGSAFRALTVRGMMDDSAYVQQLTRLVDGCVAGAIPRPKVLLVSSSVHTHDVLHQQLEEAGLMITAEDGPSGSGAVAPDLLIEGDHDTSVLSHFLAHGYDRNAFPFERRHRWTLAELAGHTYDGVVFHVTGGDDVFGWDLPRLRAAADAGGIRSAVVVEAVDAISAASKRFAAELTEGRAS